MSKTIDQKVVQMQFDNAQFEQNAKQSMSTLDKLKAALKFDGANKGVDELNKSIGNLDFSKAEVMATRAGFHIQDVFLKISNVLEYQIARKIIHLGEDIAKSMTLDQVKAGFGEYELKMGSIQTIMAGTGEKLEVVNKYLNELNEYSDKTIYSFSDMTQNIGKFTNAGVKLKDAVAAIQGVANVAAVSGANAQEASRAMYNFAQALSAGYVKLIDWKSIENANMATVEFKDTLLQTAEAMGYAKSNGDGYYKILTKNAQGKTMDSAISATKNFNDSLAFQWMKTNVLTQALEIYSKDVRTMTEAEKDAYEEKLRSKGFTDEQIKQFEELGIKATKAASEVKTFSQLMDTIKESIGSGWAMSFEHIIGNFEEAKELFTEVNDAVGVVIASIDNQRNKMLENWKKMGGRDDLIQAFRNIAGALGDVIKPIKDVFNQIFPPLTSVRLVEITKKFKEWTASLRLNKEQQEELRVVLHYLLTPIKIIVEAIKLIAKLIPPLLRIGIDLVKVIVSITAAFINLVKNSETFKTVVNSIRTALATFKQGVSAAIKFLKELATTIAKSVVGSLKDSNSWISKTINLFKALGGITLVGLRTAFNSIANFKFSNIISGLEKLKARFKEIGESNKIVKLFLDGFEKLQDAFHVVAVAAEVFFDGLKERLEKAETFGDFLQAIWDSLKDGYDFLKEFIESKFFTDGPGLFDTIKKAFSDFISVLTGGLGKIPWAKLVLIGFTLALVSCTINLVNAITKFGGLAAALRETILIVNNTIKTFTGLRNRLIELKEIAIFITALTAAVGILAVIDMKGGNIVKAAATLGILAAGLMVLAEAMLWINSKNVLNPASLGSLMMAIGALVAGTAVLVAAAGALKDMSMSFKEALPYIATLGALMWGMLAAMTVLTIIGRDKKIFTAGAMSILSYATAVYILAKGLASLASVKFVDVNSLLKLVATTLAGFAAITALAGKFSSFVGFASIIAMAIAFKQVAAVFQDLSQLNITEDAKYVLDMVTSLVRDLTITIALAYTLSKIFGQGSIITKTTIKHANKLKLGFNSLSLNILAVSASILMIGKAFDLINKNLQQEDGWGNFVALLVIFASIVTALALVFRAINKSEHELKGKNSIVKFAASVLALTTALIPLTICLDLLSSIVANHAGEDIAIASVIIAGIGVLIGGLMWASGQASFTDFKVLLSIFAGFSLILAELVAITFIVEKHGGALLASLGVLIAVVTTMGIFIGKLSKMNIGGVKIAPLISITVMLGTLAAALIVSAKLIKVEDWFGLVALLGGFFLVLSTIGYSLQKMSKMGFYSINIAPLIAMASLFALFAGAMITACKTLKLEDWPGLVFLVGGFAAVVTTITIALKAIQSDFSDFAIILAFAGVLVVVAGALIALSQVPWQTIAASAGIMVVFTFAMMALMAAVSAIDMVLPGSAVVFAVFAAGVGVLVGGMSLFVAAIGFFVNAVTKMITALTELGKNGEQVAAGIRKVVPAITDGINKIATSIMQSAPKLAEAARQLVLGLAKGLADGAVYIAQAIATVIQTLAPLIDEGLHYIGNKITEGIRNLLTQLIVSALNFREAGRQLLENFIAGLLGGGEVGQAAAMWLSELISNLIPGGSILKSIGQMLKGEFLQGATPTEGEIQVINESYDMAYAGAVNSGFKGAERELTAGEKKLKKKSEAIPASVQGAIKQKAKEGNKTAQEYSTQIADGFYAGWNKVDRFVYESKTKVSSIWDSISNNGVVQTAKNALGDFTGSIKDYFGDVIPSFDEFSLGLDDVTKGLEDTVPAAGAAGDALEETGDKAKKGAKGVKEAKDEITSFVEKMEQSFNILDEFDLGLDEENPLTGDKIISNMRSNIEGMAKWSSELSSLGTKISQGLYKKLADMGPTGYKYVHAFAEMTKEQLDEVNRYYATSLLIPTNVTTQIYQGMYEAGNNVYTGLLNGMNIPQWQALGINAATTLLAGMTDPAGLDTHSPSKKTFQIGIYVTEGLSNGIKDPSAKEGLFYTIKNMCVEIIRNFRLNLAADNFKDIGQQVLRGLNSGINSKEPDVLRSVTNLCEAVERRACKTLEIHSPSRVFAKIGARISEGMAKGISNNITMVEDSTQRMAEATVENMRGAIETIQAVVDSDIDVEPVIRPVVDLSNVNSGSAAISSLMQSNFGTNVNMPQANFMTTSQLISNSDNSNVVTAIGMLQEDVVNLKDAMTNIKVMLDTGTMVGAMTPAIDQELYSRQMYAGRGM